MILSSKVFLKSWISEVIGFAPNTILFSCVDCDRNVSVGSECLCRFEMRADHKDRVLVESFAFKDCGV